MSLELKQLQAVVHRSLTTLNFKVRSKQELIEIANSLNANTIGTKDSLLQNISLKLSEFLYQFRGRDFNQVSMQQIIEVAKKKNLPKKMEPMIKQVFMETRKNITKSAQKSRNNHSNPIMKTMPFHYNNMYNFSPTVQNYNFSYPYYHPNYPSHPYYFPFNMMNSQGVPYHQGTSNNYPMMQAMQQFNNLIHNNPLPHFQSPNPPNEDKKTIIDKQIILPPPTLPAGNQHLLKQKPDTIIPSSIHNSQTPPIVPIHSIPPQPLLSSQFLQMMSKMPIPTQTMPKSPLKQITTTEMKVPCICRNTGKGLATAKCLHCSILYHHDCLNISGWSKRQLKNFECPRCTIRRIDPLNTVRAVLIEQKINFQMTPQFFKSVKLQPEYMNELKQQNMTIEYRSIRLDGNSNYDISWPDYGTLQTIDKTVDFKPLQSNSSMKKRKDEIIVVDKQMVLKKGNISIKLEIKQVTRQLQRSHRIRTEGQYIVGVYLIKKITTNELIEKIINNPSINLQTCKQKIMSHFKDNDDISLQKLTIKLHDPILLNRIKIPARGIFCEHPQCFSLDTFILMMSKSQNRLWKCPICNYRCQNMYKDFFLASILEKADEDKSEVQFYPNGDFNILGVKEQCSDSDQRKPQKKQTITQVIIDDDSQDNIVPQVAEIAQQAKEKQIEDDGPKLFLGVTSSTKANYLQILQRREPTLDRQQETAQKQYPLKSLPFSIIKD